MTSLLFFLLVLLSATVTYTYLYVGRRDKNLPPGPPTVPILGNIHQIPKKGSHFQLTRWAQQYGGIYSFKLGTGTAVVVTDRRLVKELFDKKSSIYSQRPSSYVANLISAGDHILLMKYGPQWRGARKLLHGTFMEKTVDEEYVPLQEAEGRQMLKDYLVRPEEHMLHPKRYSNSIIMSIVWGVRTPTPETEHMKRLYSLMEIWSKVMETGATPPVDVYAFLHHLPQSIFLHWRDRAHHVRKEMNGLYSDFLKGLRARRASSGSRNSYMDKVLDQAESGKPQPEGLAFSDHELYFAGGTVTEGGSDTTASIITAFVQAMATNPHIQARAQVEIDAIVGESRSPTWADYTRLPYVAQCVKETMRWRPVTPLAFPHALTQDDWVDGVFLPAGTTVILNAWGLQHDPAEFERPEAFDPEHFAGVTALAAQLANGSPGERDHYGYGAGRRLCPGIHLAERGLFIAMAKILWGFEIRHKCGADGKRVFIDTDPRTGYSDGFLVCANDFEAEFVVRGEGRRRTIEREYEEARTVFAKNE